MVHVVAVDVAAAVVAVVELGSAAVQGAAEYSDADDAAFAGMASAFDPNY